ncbi:MAG: hypothetical protein HYY51_04740 [Candidatus Magasanikbacteria bacterium]|nr:hypothetical protein [Candidatus Magasanikbacteria bacterium]
MFFSTSQDLLYIVLSLSILWFTVFLCWLLYQAARVLRNANTIIENVTQKLELIADAMEFIKGKVDSLSGKMGFVGKMMSTLVDKFVIGKLSGKLEDRLEGMGIEKKKRKNKKFFGSSKK